MNKRTIISVDEYKQRLTDTYTTVSNMAESLRLALNKQSMDKEYIEYLISSCETTEYSIDTTKKYFQTILTRRFEFGEMVQVYNEPTDIVNEGRFLAENPRYKHRYVVLLERDGYYFADSFIHCEKLKEY